ncbi:membrane protein insertion efficiency factor YidD [Bifidobacterium catulorum]|uniref:Putative membrane protein insertion efficiency factor n=1 Tax=Bifidobacterium catulorum TaxID=1630173 RepID=A0A2U2MU16_9BIFI|nr:membrane protein insertion efficiency factor YidD [Bifidobacterium catulorum]PWG60361.1 membrane protein insertion efficiency factor YidD [Bifidobacterium catulorum]
MSIMAGAMIGAIRWYQRRISPLFGPCCKYYPSCSHYAVTAIRRFGAFRGGVLATLRLLRCRPWSIGGIDDVPRRFSIFYRFSWSKAHEEPRLTPLYHEETSTEHSVSGDNHDASVPYAPSKPIKEANP